MSARYVVVESYCMECTFDGSSEPKIIERTESLEDATALASEVTNSREVDRFVMDTKEGAIVWSTDMDSTQ